MTILDLGCSPGFFSVYMAGAVGPAGKVIAADLQDGMLEKLSRKIRGTELEGRIILHKCDEGKIGLTEKVDFILLFYLVHEVSDKEAFFREIAAFLNPKGIILMVEPPIHVTKKAFEVTIRKAVKAGLIISGRPKSLINKIAVLKKPQAGSIQQR